MLALRDFQTAFRQAMFNDGKHDGLDAMIAGEGLASAHRIGIYRDNVIVSLTEVLRQTFPVVCRLVGDGFFNYAAHEFICAHPPARPQLSHYGGALAAFLAEFPPCRDLAYLPDVARFEWAINEAAIAPDITAARPDILRATTDPVNLRVRLHQSWRYLSSPWPLDRIWQANQPEANGDGIDLNAGPVWLEVARRENDVTFRSLQKAEFAFRNALSRGIHLGGAIDTALAAHPDFVAAEALKALFRDGAVIAIAAS